MNVPRPQFGVVPLAEGLGWTAASGFLYEEKMDGRWHELAIGRSVVVGELMRDGRFYAFDLPIYDGQDVRRWPLRERLAALDAFNLLRPARGDGGEFLRAVLNRGGEGVVAKHLDAPFGVDWHKCKRQETFDCVVVEMDHARGTLRLMLDGQDAGWCPARAKFDSIRLGDVVEIAAHSRHASGKFREARFVRTRPDKIHHNTAP